MRVALDKIILSFDICFYIFLIQWILVTEKAKAASGVPPPTCRLKPDDGPCRGSIAMYYYNPKSGDCEKFSWGGCQGNGNRFNTRRECISKCKNNDTTITSRPKWCSLSFDYGYCFGAIPRYYYDPLWKVCKQRIYSGCGGNQNNFYSHERCEAICVFTSGKTGKITAFKKTSGKKVIIINPSGATKKRGLEQKKHSTTTQRDKT